jgi:hypothetical protein
MGKRGRKAGEVEEGLGNGERWAEMWKLGNGRGEDTEWRVGE